MKKNSSDKDYYDLLGIDEDASQDDIDRAYKSQARIYHPDSGGTEEEMKLLNEAHDILGDPDRRKEYDEERKPPLPFIGSSAVFDPEAASRAGTLEVPVSGGDITGLLIFAGACFGVGIPLLLLIEAQWVFFLWPLRVLTLGALVLGVFILSSALRTKQRYIVEENPSYSISLLWLQRILFWVLMITLLGAIFFMLYGTKRR